MVCQLQETWVRKLLDFGLTVNQAKVYWSIVQSGLTCVSKISEFTQLHRQDIYKILPKLEKMGLIMKTIDKPIIIEAIPVEKALNSLVSTERKKANERISRLEANLKELINAIRGQQEGRTTQEQEALFTLLTTDDAIKYKADFACANAKIEYDLVTNLELIPQRMHCLYDLQALARRGAKIRLIVENLANEDLVKRTLEKIIPNNGNFAAELIYKSSSVPYQIIDHKEVWIPTQKETESGFPCFLWTNDKNIVQSYEEKFNETWNDHHAISIYPERCLAEERISKSSVSDTKRFYTATDSFFIE